MNEQPENSAYRLHGHELPVDPKLYSERVREIAEQRRTQEAEFWARLGEVPVKKYLTNCDPGDETNEHS